MFMVQDPSEVKIVLQAPSVGRIGLLLFFFKSPDKKWLVLRCPTVATFPLHSLISHDRRSNHLSESASDPVDSGSCRAASFLHNY